MTEAAENALSPAAMLAKHKLEIASSFVPFSQSRNKAEKSPSLNWRVMLKQDGRAILTTDYSAGCAHAPGYKQYVGKFSRYERDRHAAYECERGFATESYGNSDSYSTDRKRPILPKPEDVIHSLINDSDVLDAGGFEEWARDCGYDTDSRAAEATCRACLEIALKLRAGLGDAVLFELREAFRDY